LRFVKQVRQWATAPFALSFLSKNFVTSSCELQIAIFRHMHNTFGAESVQTDQIKHRRKISDLTDYDTN
jgi:hypothetical protein